MIADSKGRNGYQWIDFKKDRKELEEIAYELLFTRGA